MYLYLTNPIFLFAFLIGGLLFGVNWFYRRKQRQNDKTNIQRQSVFFIRTIIILLFTLVFAGLSIKRPADERRMIFLVDESKSIDSESREFINDFLQDSLDTNTKISRSFISFARNPMLSEFAQRKINRLQNANESQTDSPAESEIYWSDETNIESAIALAASLFNSSDCNCEITLISDGNETVGNAIAAAAICKIPISTVPIPESKSPEISVSEFNVPAELKAGEPFNIDLTIYCNQSTETDISIFRNEF
jgi:hypothetical protein